MALDGLTIKYIINELKDKIINGKIDKIYQPENDEVVLTIRKNSNYRLLLTSHSSYPRIHFTNSKKENPITAPLFCMLLRKHLLNNILIDIKQISFDRIVELHFEGRNELGDLCTKKLIIEIMGKYSNIILVDDNNTIIDSIKRVNYTMSSVREVLPGKPYTNPPSQNKLNPLDPIDIQTFTSELINKDTTILKSFYTTFMGVSPIVSKEICFNANIDTSLLSNNLTEEEYTKLYENFTMIFHNINSDSVCPIIISDTENNEIIDFSPILLNQFKHLNLTKYDTISETIEQFYIEKDQITRIKQKSYDLHKLVQTTLDRCLKKEKIQITQLKDTENKSKWKEYGELITANIYNLEEGMKNFKTQNFYSDDLEEITIPLQINLTPSQNAQKFFKKYNKAKRTFAALTIQLVQTKEELSYLQSILTSLDFSTSLQDIATIREELYNEGYIKKKKFTKAKKLKVIPLEFESSEGLKILVGKNNIQNDHLTFKIASPFDLWFHAKDMPGSHVILCCNNESYTDQSIIEAANIAAYHSKGKFSSKVPIDYTQRRYVKKPSGAKPGFVIFKNQNTAYVTPIKDEILKLQKQ